MSTLSPEKQAYSITEAAAAVGLSDRSLRDEITNSRLLAKRFGKKIIIPSDSLKDWLDNLPDA